MTEAFGSPYFIAPEVIKGCYNNKCDVWSVGVILHIMLVNHPPFDNKDHNKLIKMIKDSKKV